MNRRQVIAVCAATLVPVAEAAAQMPIMALYRRYCILTVAADQHVCTTPDPDEELQQLFFADRDQIEDQIMALPCVSAADFAAKMIVDSCRGDLCSDWQNGSIWIEARALTATPAAMVMI